MKISDPDTWPEALQGAFWLAVNAPTYEESTEKTAVFAGLLAHELAEKIRAHVADTVRQYGPGEADQGALDAADLIDPEVSDG